MVDLLEHNKWLKPSWEAPITDQIRVFHETFEMVLNDKGLGHLDVHLQAANWTGIGVSDSTWIQEQWHWIPEDADMPDFVVICDTEDLGMFSRFGVNEYPHLEYLYKNVPDRLGDRAVMYTALHEVAHILEEYEPDYVEEYEGEDKGHGPVFERVLKALVEEYML